MKAVIIIESENVEEIRWFSDKVSKLSDEYQDIELTYCEEEK